MNIELVVTILGVGTSLLVLKQGYEWWKNRNSKTSVDVVSSAVQLLKPYREEVEALRKSLQGANQQIRELTDKLTAAETRAFRLNNELADAQLEVRILQGQVKTMSLMLGKDEDETGRG